jgi:bifunctional DNA-binding transcriptional regulator/antitoxin component of YhaV-PrlF toxin-antitoxin module
MKLQKQLSKKRGAKKYYRYTINIPEELLQKAELKEGDSLIAEAKKGEIRLRRLGAR